MKPLKMAITSRNRHINSSQGLIFCTHHRVGIICGQLLTTYYSNTVSIPALFWTDLEGMAVIIFFVLYQRLEVLKWLLKIHYQSSKLLLLFYPIKTGVNSTMNQSEFLAITCPLLKALETSCLLGAISFGFASQRLKKLAWPLLAIP